MTLYELQAQQIKRQQEIIKQQEEIINKYFLNNCINVELQNLKNSA